MRKILPAAIGAFVLALVALTAYAMFSFQHRVQARVQAVQKEIADRARLDARVKRVHLRWLPSPAVVVDDASVVRLSKGGGGTVVVENARVVVIPRLRALLGGGDDIRRIEVQNARFVTRPEEKESALAVLPLVRAAAAPVALRDCSIQIDRGADFPLIEAQHVDLKLVPREGTVEFSGTMSPLGERSHADVSGVWRPGVGRTGGDGFKIDLKVRKGDPAALPAFVPLLKRPGFTDDIVLDVTAEGFLGERTTEVLPADPLSGRVHAEVGLDILGVTHPAIFDSGISLDDKRWVLQDGKGKWGARPFTFAGWIARAPAVNKMNLRMSFEHVDAASVLAEYKIDERWHPKADVSADIRMEGTFDYPLTRYEARIPSLRFDAWPSWPISSGPMTVRGSLLAINADVSASCETNELKVGTITIPKVLAGTTWWRNKLTVTSMNLPLWGGKLDASAAFEPGAAERIKGGALMHDFEAATFFEQVLPNLGLKIVDGRMDGTGEFGERDGERWYRGRIGLHEGELGPHDVMRQVVDEITRAAGGDSAAIDELAARHPALAPDHLKFTRLALDFQSQSPGAAVHVGDVITDGGTLTLDGTIDAAKQLNAAGVAVFAPTLAADLGRRIAPLAKLVSEDGSLQAPVRVEGPAAELKVTLGQDFATALQEARAGKNPGPFTVPKPTPSFQLEGLPPLDEQFGR